MRDGEPQWGFHETTRNDCQTSFVPFPVVADAKGIKHIPTYPSLIKLEMWHEGWRNYEICYDFFFYVHLSVHELADV